MKFFHVKNYLITGILIALVSVNATANVSGPGPIPGSENVLQGKLTFDEQATVSVTITPEKNLTAGRLSAAKELANIKAKASASNAYVAIKWSTSGDIGEGFFVRNIYEVDDKEKKYPLKVKLNISSGKQDGEWSVGTFLGEINANLMSYETQTVKPGSYNFEITSAIWYDENQV